MEKIKNILKVLGYLCLMALVILIGCWTISMVLKDLPKKDFVNFRINLEGLHLEADTYCDEYKRCFLTPNDLEFLRNNICK